MRCPLAAPTLALAWLGACAAAPRPLALPARGLVVHHRAAGEGPAADRRSPQTLHIELLGLREAPTGPAVDLVARTIAREDGAPFRGASSLPAGSRWLAGEHYQSWQAARTALGPERLQSLAVGESVLVPGLATVVTVPGTTLPEVRLTAATDGDGDGSRIVVELAPTGNSQSESIGLAHGLSTTEGAVLFVPATATGEAAGHALVLTVRDAPPTSESVAAARADAQPPPTPPSHWPEPWRQALTAVGPHVRRPALLALVQSLPLSRVRDVLLIADDQALIDITAELCGVEPTAADLAWQFERAVWRALLPRLEREELTAALSSACWRHLGTTADDAGLLRLTLASAGNAEAFAAALREENLGALAARDAAQRVRGHDWLLANGGSVDGYSPLDPPETRRAALRARASARAAAEVGR